MNMRKLFSVLIMIGFAISAMAQQKIVIKGTVKGDLKGYNKVYVLEDGIKKDSVEIKNGRFTISMPWVKDVFPSLQAEYDTTLRPRQSAFPIVADAPGTIYLDVADVNKGLRSGKIRGNRSASAFQEFEAGREQVRVEVKATVNERFPNSAPNDSAYSMAFMQLIQQRLLSYIGSFVEDNANAYIGVFILGRYQSVLPAQDLERLYNKLGPLQKRTLPGKEVAARLIGFKRAVPGFEVVDFTLNTQKDQPTTFSSFRGKYVLIDFWASWCGPCKASFPYVKELYQQYRSDKFEILGISIDQHKTAWLNELEKQQLPWPQLLDTKNVSVNSFAVTAVPTAYLISPEGKIIMKQVGLGEEGDGEIEKKLKELFGH
jgi:thiol-disulfide isomerase/thioredoxin